MLEWMIFGGGIHGTYFANLLIRQAGVPADKPAILDSHDRLLKEWELPCNTCGYPIVGDDLQWGPNLYVTGPLAELQAGPCARNIVGARNAGRMLLASRS